MFAVASVLGLQYTFVPPYYLPDSLMRLKPVPVRNILSVREVLQYNKATKIVNNDTSTFGIWAWNCTSDTLGPLFIASHDVGDKRAVTIRSVCWTPNERESHDRVASLSDLRNWFTLAHSQDRLNEDVQLSWTFPEAIL